MTPYLAAAAVRPIPPHFTAITMSAGAVCLTLVFLMRWKPLQRLEFLTPWLVLLAGIGFGAAFLNDWANSAAGFARSFPYIGVAIPIMVAIVLLYIVGYDFWPKHASNTVTKVAAFLLPAFSPTIGGTVGTVLANALSWIAVGGATLLGAGFGV